jgi:predicted nucleic acid-binding Zn ribbon protein
MKYDYRCRECENVWEVDHPMKVSDAVAELGLFCPNCESSNIFKYLGNMATTYIQFKGTGFSINDAALDKVKFPKHYRDNPEVKNKLDKL